jgi:hypothetical protein
MLRRVKHEIATGEIVEANVEENFPPGSLN